MKHDEKSHKQFKRWHNEDGTPSGSYAEGALIHHSVVIEEGCAVGDRVTLKEGVEIRGLSTITGEVTLGSGTKVHSCHFSHGEVQIGSEGILTECTFACGEEEIIQVGRESRMTQCNFGGNLQAGNRCKITSTNRSDLVLPNETKIIHNEIVEKQTVPRPPAPILGGKINEAAASTLPKAKRPHFLSKRR